MYVRPILFNLCVCPAGFDQIACLMVLLGFYVRMYDLLDFITHISNVRFMFYFISYIKWLKMTLPCRV